MLNDHTDNVNSIALDHKFVYSISDDATLRVYSKADWTEVLCVKVPVMRIDSLALDENAVYIACSDGSIRCLLKSQIED